MKHCSYTNQHPRLTELCLGCRMKRCRGICDEYCELYSDLFKPMPKRVCKAIPYDYPITIDGITRPMREWADEKGINYQMLYGRIVKHGMTPEQAIAKGPGKPGKLYEYCGETRSLAEWSWIYHIRVETIKERLKCGWTLEEALETPPRARRRGRKEAERGTDICRDGATADGIPASEPPL